MKKILCELFGENEHIYFNIARLAQLEQLEKRSITEIFKTDIGLSTVINAYTIGLSQYRRRDPNWYATELQKLLDDGKTLMDFIEPVMKALVGSGAFGKQAYYEAFPEELTEEAETDLKVEKKRKNK